MFPISSSLPNTDHKVKDDQPGDPIHWRLHSSSVETSVEESNSHEIGNQELAALELSPIGPRTGSTHLMNVSSFSDTTVAEKSPASPPKSDSPGVESGKDYSSISSFSTLTSASKLPTEDFDFINFYFENNWRQTQLKENSVCEIPVPIARRNRFLDCSPIPKLNFDETLVNLPSPDTGCSHIRTSPASAESILEEELNEVKRTSGGYIDESVACAGSFSRPPAFLSVPVNSPNATAEMGGITGSSKLWYCPQTEVDGLPMERLLSQGVTNFSPESAAQKWKLESRPPCVGQEYSPESEFNYPETRRAIRSAGDPCLSPSATETVDSDIDLTEINPPSPVLKNSARKVGSWLQRLQEDECSEYPAVETSLAIKASALNAIECVHSSEKGKCVACDDYMYASKELVGKLHDASIATSFNRSTVPSSSVPHFKTLSGVARKQWANDSSLIAVVPPIHGYQHQHCDEKVKRHYRRTRRSGGVKRHELYNLVIEKKLQNMESDGSCTRTTCTNETEASNSSGAKHGHHAQNSYCRKSKLLSDDNRLCNGVADTQAHKTLTRNPSSTVFFVGHTLNPPQPMLKRSQVSSKRVLAKKLKAISLYMQHKKTHSHLNFKTLAIV